MSSVDAKRSIHGWRDTVKRVSLLLIVAGFLLVGRAMAIGTEEVIRSQGEALDLDSLEEAAGEYAPDIDWYDNPDLNSGLSDLLKTGTKSIQGAVRKALRSSVLLLAVVFLSGIAEGAALCGSGKTVRAVPIAAALAVTSIAATDANTLIGLGREVVVEMESFSKILLPTVAAATAASGSPGGAAARQMAAMLFSDVLITLINRLLLPLVYAYIAAGTAYAAVGNEGIKRIASTLKWIITSVLTAVLLAFVGYLTVSGVIAGTTDAIALKAAKFTVSSVVPVVGGILSDATETILVGAGILKNSVGVFGMLAVLGMCIVPFLQLGVHYLMYKMTAALAATVAEPRVAGLIDGIGGAFGLILGMTGACALLLLVSIISAVSVTSV